MDAQIALTSAFEFVAVVPLALMILEFFTRGQHEDCAVPQRGRADNTQTHTPYDVQPESFSLQDWAVLEPLLDKDASDFTIAHDAEVNQPQTHTQPDLQDESISPSGWADRGRYPTKQSIGLRSYETGIIRSLR